MDHQEQDGYKSSLETPLIIPSSTDNSGSTTFGDGASLRNKCRAEDNFAEITTELKNQLQLAGPLVLVSFLQYSLQMISVMFVGRLGELSLSSASMATSFAGVTGFGFMLGMGGAPETLCGQAYGAKQYHMLGVHMQRAMLVPALISIPVSLVWSCTEKIFRFLHQDPQITVHSGTYARWLIPSIVPYGLLQCQLRFLQTQNIVWPLMISTGITSSVHVLVCWTLIFRFGFGNVGAALSNAISYWTNVLILALYIKFSPSCQKTWTGFSKEGAKNLVSFLAIGIPSALMVCLEFWSYEFIVLMSGLLPNPKLETSMMSMSLNTSYVVFRIAFGLGSAVSSLIELNVSFNILTYLPTNIGYELANLQRLSAQMNKLRSFPTSIGDMKCLRQLDAHFNESRGLPFSIGSLTNFEVLNLSNNFSDLRELPESFGDSISLKELDLSNNQIQALPDSFGRLDNLTKLNLDQNPLVMPPPEVVNGGVDVLRTFMAKRWLDILVEKERKSMLEVQEEAQTGWLTRSTSWLKTYAAGVSEIVSGYLSPRSSTRDPFLDQQL